MYLATFTDGAKAECCLDHLWYVNTPLRRHRGNAGRVLSLEQIANSIKDSTGKRQHFIPMVEPVEFDSVDDLPMDPYVLGVLLGDGGFSTNSCILTNGDDNVISRVREQLAPLGVTLEHADRTSWRIAGEGPGIENPVIEIIRSLGLWGHRSTDKFIPTAYAFASVEARCELLRGLMDTDGSPRSESMTIEYTSSSRELAFGVKSLCESLGMSVRMSSRIPKYTYRGKKLTGKESWRLNVNPGNIIPFWRPSKLAKWTNGAPHKYTASRAFKSVTKLDERECVCISVDAHDHLYVTTDFVVTHNTIQALVAAPTGVGIVVTCPKIAKGVWQREAARWRPDLTVTILEGRGSFRWPRPGEMIVTNYELLPGDAERPAILASAPAGVVLIADEGHALKGVPKKVARSRSWRALSDRVRETGGRAWIVTGTPLLNDPSELWNLLRHVGLERTVFGTWDDFVAMCGGRPGLYGGLQWGGKIDPSVPERLRRASIRRLKSEVMREMPEKIVDVIDVDLADLARPVARSSTRSPTTCARSASTSMGRSPSRPRTRQSSSRASLARARCWRRRKSASRWRWRLSSRRLESRCSC